MRELFNIRKWEGEGERAKVACLFNKENIYKPLWYVFELVGAHPSIPDTFDGYGVLAQTNWRGVIAPQVVTGFILSRQLTRSTGVVELCDRRCRS